VFAVSTILETTDAMTWATEFCRIFHGYMVVKEGTPESPLLTIDEGTMVSWFANAMAVAEREASQKFCPHPEDERIELSETLTSCRGCGLLNPVLNP
jgi:hypothetical protein